MGYSAFRMFEESLRVDPSEHFLGLRLNMYVAAVLTIAGLVWFVYSQRHGRPASELRATGPGHVPAVPATRVTGSPTDAPGARRCDGAGRPGEGGRGRRGAGRARQLVGSLISSKCRSFRRASRTDV